MKSFLYETALDLVNRFGEDLSSVEIIFPNKRTDFHFKKHLSEILKKISWSPKTFTIQQFIGRISKIRSIDNISLLFQLFEVFRQVDKDFNLEFDAFIKLGEIILNDFNEIDYYLVEPSQIFTNIKNLHEIDSKYSNLTDEQLEIIRQYWKNFSPEEKSREKEKFLALWNILPLVYEKFTKSLLQKKLGYEGLIYRQIYNLLRSNELEEPSDFIVFIGFNALNKAQKILFRYLKNKNKAAFYWDNDSYYHHNKIQEAGDFLRVNYEFLSENQGNIPGNFSAFEKNIKLIGFPGNIGQAKAIPTILKELENENGILENPEKTVLVLPDENMLFPVLHSIPENIPSLNITMGYPLKNTPLFSLLLGFLKIQLLIHESTDNRSRIYHKDVLAIIGHPYIQPLFPIECRQIADEIVNKQMIYVPAFLLLNGKNKIFETVFTPPTSKSAVQLPVKILNLLFLLYTFHKEKQVGLPALDNEGIYHAYLEIKKLNEILTKNDIVPELGVSTIVQFIKQIFSGLRIPFESKSTDGLQIMGLIETRNLDFDNVLLLNANEGILPKLGRPPSLISESMRHAFELPVIKYQDAIFAYFFYRLLQRARNIYILYDNLGSSNKSGELSRFVYQVELESGHKVSRLELDQNLKLLSVKPIVIEKNNVIVEKLKNYLSVHGKPDSLFTATALDTYLNCPLQFYFKYIAAIKEPEKVEEEFTPQQMGVVIHFAMELFYRNKITFNGTNRIEKKDFDNTSEMMESIVEKAFRYILSLSETDKFEFTGNLWIVKEVILKYLSDILNYDKNRAPFEIVHLEEKDDFFMTMETEFQNQNLNTGLRGIIDRIDKIGNDLYVIDYKTGKAEKEFADLSELFNRDTSKRKKAIFQVFLYALLVKNNNSFSGYNLVPGIYDIKQMYSNNFSPAITIKIEKEKVELRSSLFNASLDDFNTELKNLVDEILNPGIAFYQTEFEKNCIYCSYRSICTKD
ncbi:MAG: PD-(D/E)XK nuclease family protein [Bacteroidales bacterium]